MYNSWVEVDLDALAHNMRETRRLAKSPLVCAVIKANGYGHGAVKIAATLLENGANRLAVASPKEAMELREAYPEVPILILGEVPDDAISMLVNGDISLAVTSKERAEKIADVIQKIALSSERGEQEKKKATIHIKVDTGMGRIGFVPNEKSADQVAAIYNNPLFNVEGIFSHFANADVYDKSSAHQQGKMFKDFIQMLENRNVQIPIKHICNSAGIMDLPEYHFDMVRAGIILYGLPPSGHVHVEKIDLIPAMTLKTRVTFVKSMEKDKGISYGHMYKTEKDEERIATISIGYAEGISRNLSQKMDVLIRGKRYRQVGRICMDQSMVRVSDDIQAGDEVVIFGQQEYGQKTALISIEELAALLQTISYELICRVGKMNDIRYINSESKKRNFKSS